MERKDKPDSHGLWNSVQWGTKMLLCKHSSGLKCFFSWSLYSFETFMASCPCHQRNPPGTYWLQICLAHICTCCMHIHTHTHMHQEFFFPNFAELLFLLLSGETIQWYTSLSEIGQDSCPTEFFLSTLCVSSWKLTIDRFTLVFDPTSSVTVFFQMFPSWVAITKSTGQVGL